MPSSGAEEIILVLPEMNIYRFTLLLFLLFAIWQTANGENPAQGYSHLPKEWLLLADSPKLWLEPDGARDETSLSAKALDQVTAEEKVEKGDARISWIKVTCQGKSGWLPEALLAPVPEIKIESLEKIGQEPVDRFHGIPASYVPQDLATISHGYEKGPYRLRKEAAEALEKMIRAARHDDIMLKVVSAYRSYDTQRSVYLKKIEKSGWGQTTVAKPGHSEHQLGTAVDLTDGNEETLLEESFGDSPAGKWLLQRAPDFGFAISYTAANGRTTHYSPEPWHYRYYGPQTARERHDTAIKGPKREDH